MKTPPWKLIVHSICFELCKYRKSDTDPVLYRYYYSELCDSFTDHTFIFTGGSKDGDSRCHQQPPTTKHKHTNLSAKYHTTTNIFTGYHHGV